MEDLKTENHNLGVALAVMIAAAASLLLSFAVMSLLFLGAIQESQRLQANQPVVINTMDINWRDQLYRRVPEASLVTKPVAKEASLPVGYSLIDFEHPLRREVMVKRGFRFWIWPAGSNRVEDIREYRVADDGSVYDTQYGVVLFGNLDSVDYASPSTGLEDVLGPDGRPWFKSRIWRMPEWEGRPWVFLKPIPGYIILFEK